jgi:hypothetical protein
VTIKITEPEIEQIIRQRLERGGFKDAEDVIFQALQSSSEAPAREIDPERFAAIEELKTFGEAHGISLGDMTIRQLRDEARS